MVKWFGENFLKSK